MFGIKALIVNIYYMPSSVADASHYNHATIFTFIPTFFQALQYLRKLCNHPSLVLTPQHPEYKRITEQLAGQNSSLRDLQHAPKLSALKQVLCWEVFQINYSTSLLLVWATVWSMSHIIIIIWILSS